MAGRTKASLRPTPSVLRVWLREDVTRTATPLRVDRDKGVIYGVKILGWTSENGRDYDPQAARAKLQLYEGAKCFVDHPDPRQGPKARDGEDGFGVFRGPVWKPDGVYADLHYFKSHPMAERVCEDVERGIGFFGMSHNAQGDVERRGGRQVVTAILKVASVDLVTDPATVTNLWEGKAVKTTIKAVLESNKAIKPRARKLLLEMGPDMGAAYTQPMPEAPAPGQDGAAPEENARDVLARGLMLLLKSGDNGDHSLAIKLMKILKPGGSGSAMGTPAPDLDELDEDEDLEEEDEFAGDDEDDEEEEEGPPVKESKKAKKPAPAAAVLTEADAKGLCEVAGVKATPAVLTLMTGKPLAEARAALELAKGGAASVRGNAPRSTGPGGTPLRESKAATTAEEQAKLLLR